ncbi:MAG: LemA family protein [Flavobacteriales bacterium]|nr:LemA family protein [Flavobacteriales bacterium]
MYIIIFLAIILVPILWAISIFNGLVRLRNRRENAFADIDVQLRQRHDLVPQLVETVKGYSSHEKEILIRVSEARSAAMNAKSVDDKIMAEQQLTNVLAGLRVQVEAYPDLKANTNFLRLQEELGDIENKLSASRRFFNGATTEYNNAVETFPGNIVAGFGNFKREIFFDLGKDNRERMEEPPVVKF